jgi:hypothetical protein
MYERGDGVLQNFVEAVLWFRRLGLRIATVGTRTEHRCCLGLTACGEGLFSTLQTWQRLAARDLG